MKLKKYLLYLFLSMSIVSTLGANLLFAHYLKSENALQSKNGATSVKDSLEIYTYPNPFKDDLIVTINSVKTPFTSIKIFDLIGTQIFEVDLTSKSLYFSHKLDLDQIRPGIYSLSIYSQKGLLETKKIVKIK